MVYKKYIKRDGKVYGPYHYHSKKIDGKVTSHYIGKDYVKNKKKIREFDVVYRRIKLPPEPLAKQLKTKLTSGERKVKTYFIIGILLLSFFILLNMILIDLILSGKVTLSVEGNYLEGEQINGNLKLSLEKGEFVPTDTKVIIDNAGEQSEYLLSDLVSNSVTSGDFYIEETSISDSGEGYGIIGEKEIYPDVGFTLKISEEVKEKKDKNSKESTTDDTTSEDEPEVEPEVQEGEIEIIEEETLEEPVEEIPVNDETTSEGESELIEPEVQEPVVEGVVDGVEVQGVVSKNNPYIYALEEGQTAEVVSSDEDIKIKIKDNVVTVTTDYFEKVDSGESSEIIINLSSLNIKAKQGELVVTLIYDDEEIISTSKTITIIQEVSNETEDVENEFIEINVTRVNITEMTNVTLQNITVVNETIINSTVIGNISISTIQYEAVLGKPVKWKKKIKLDKEQENVIVEIPRGSQNVIVFKIENDVREELGEINGEEIDEDVEVVNESRIPITAQVISGEIISGKISAEIELDNLPKSRILEFFKKTWKKMTGRIVDVQETEEIKKVIIEENAIEFDIEYETPAPIVYESITSYGKKIVISSDVRYENILAFTSLINEMDESMIKLYKIVDDSKTQEEFTTYDTNDNGLIDYIEWIVPSLSNVTYNLYTTGDIEIINIELINCIVEYPIIYAIDNGFPVPENLNVEFGRGKEADIFRVSITEFAEMQERGEGYNIIQTHDLCGKAIGLFVLKDSELNVEELEGKTIAFETDTPIDQAILKDVLENKYGLNTANIAFEFEYPFSALDSGRADAALIVLPNYADAVKDKNLLMLLDISEDYNELYGSYPIRDVLVMKTEFGEDVAKEAIEFIKEAYDFAYDNKKDMIQTYSSEREYDSSNFFDFANTRKKEYFDAMDSVGIDSVQKTSDTAEREKKIKKSPEIKDVIIEVEEKEGLLE